jgi:hypothetical protein
MDGEVGRSDADPGRIDGAAGARGARIDGVPAAPSDAAGAGGGLVVGRSARASGIMEGTSVTCTGGGALLRDIDRIVPEATRMGSGWGADVEPVSQRT